MPQGSDATREEVKRDCLPECHDEALHQGKAGGTLPASREGCCYRIGINWKLLVPYLMLVTYLPQGKAAGTVPAARESCWNRACSKGKAAGTVPAARESCWNRTCLKGKWLVPYVHQGKAAVTVPALRLKQLSQGCNPRTMAAIELSPELVNGDQPDEQFVEGASGGGSSPCPFLPPRVQHNTGHVSLMAPFLVGHECFSERKSTPCSICSCKHVC
jgi:hypothetical protein